MAERNPEGAVVWVVDDSPLDAQRACAALGSDYDVQIFGEAGTVLEQLANGQRPGVLVIDWIMPEISGLEVCRFLQQHDPEVLTLVATAQNDTAHAVEALESGASDYLTKPYAPHELRARVRSLLRLRQVIQRARRAESTVNDLITAAPDPLFAIDSRGAIGFASAGACNALGRDQADVLHRHIEQLIPTLRLPKAAATGDPSEPVLSDVRLGERVYSPRMGRSPQGGARVLSLRDVTDRYHAELRRLDLYSVIAHDLRTPLAAMLLRVEMALAGERGILSAEMRADLVRIQRNVREQIAMINDFLEVARLQGGGYKIEGAEVDLCSLLRQVCDDFSPLAQASHLELAFVEPGCPILVRGDRRRLDQVTANLLGNAIKFTPRGGRVTLAIQERAGGARVDITDTGSGIAPDQAKMLFQRYERVEETKPVPGTGLGLMIVREVIELHGGKVGVESQPGQGSRFWFWLPSARPSPSAPTG